MDKEIEQGDKLYNKFCGLFKDIPTMIPSTFTLKMFARLNERQLFQLLLREMMKEYMKNLDDEEIVMDKKNIYKVVEKYIKL